MESSTTTAALSFLGEAEASSFPGWIAFLGSIFFTESPLSCSARLAGWLAARIGWKDALPYSLLHLVDSSSHVSDLERFIVLILYVLLSVVLMVVLWSLVFEIRDPQEYTDPKTNFLSAPGGWPQGYESAKHGLAREDAGAFDPPPLLCPGLVPHGGGAHFQVAMDALRMLRQGISPAQILGPTVSPLMHAWLLRDDGGRFGAGDARGGGPRAPGGAGGRSGLWLELTTSATLQDVHASIGPLESSGQEPVEIRGPTGIRYGFLVPSKAGCHVLHCGATVLSIASSGAFPNLKATAADGSIVAVAAPSQQGMAKGAQVLLVHAFPGADAPLALLCILAAIAMSPELTKAAPPSRMVSRPLSPTGVVSRPLSPTGTGTILATPLVPFVRAASVSAPRSAAFGTTSSPGSAPQP